MTENQDALGLRQPQPLERLVDYQEGAVVSRVIMKQDKGNVTLFAFAAGQELSENTAPFDALVQVLEGEGRISIGAEEYKVRAGEALVMPAHIPHALFAVQAFKMLLTMIRA